MPMNETQTATFAGGCFWCIETPFKYHQGVISATSGFTGGYRLNPTYEQVATGVSGHREAVQVVFDPTVVSYQELLDLFWLQIDPTDPGGGYEYTTAIYVHTDEQRELAEQSKKKLNESGKYKLPIVTEILPATEFYPAEEYHQDFAMKNPERYQQYKRLSGREAFIEKNKQE